MPGRGFSGRTSGSTSPPLRLTARRGASACVLSSPTSAGRRPTEPISASCTGATCAPQSPALFSRRSSYLNLNAILMTHDEVGQLADATSALASVFRKAGRAVAEQPDLLASYGFPWAFAELVRQDRDSPTLYGRFDFILDPSGIWKVVEYNSDTPSGIRETAVVDEIAFNFLASRFAGSRVKPSFFAPALARAFAAALPRRRSGVALGFVVDTDHIETAARSPARSECSKPSGETSTSGQYSAISTT